MTLGILTLATPNDYRKAIGLALSIRVSNPGLPVAIACSAALRPRVAPYFDFVIDEDRSLRGFEHKVHLDRYSPFEDTFFFDADVLVFRDLTAKVDEWSAQPYNACGWYVTSGVAWTGLDRAQLLARLGRERFADIGGAGHAYFRKPGCSELFELAREVTANYAEYAGESAFADEEAVSIAMTKLDLAPATAGDFFSRFVSAVPGTLEIDATQGKCTFLDRASRQRRSPFMMHFALNEGGMTYARQLRRLYTKFGADPSGLYKAAAMDLIETEIVWKAKSIAKKLLRGDWGKLAAG